MVRYGDAHVTLVVALLALATLACNLGTASEPATENVLQKPLVLLLAPENGSRYAEGAQVALHAIAQDAVVGVARVEFRVDDFPVGEVMADQPGGQPSLDAVVTWMASGQSGHLITAEGFRTDGASLGLSDVLVRVGQQPGAMAPPVQATDAPPAQPDLATPIPTPTTAPVELDAGDGPIARIIASDNLNVRQGPDTTYQVVGTLAPGTEVRIVGRNADRSWWAVAYGGGTAWILASLTTTEGDLSALPLVAPP